MVVGTTARVRSLKIYYTIISMTSAHNIVATRGKTRRIGGQKTPRPIACCKQRARIYTSREHPSFYNTRANPRGIPPRRVEKCLSSHLEVCPHSELLERPRIGQSLRDDLAGEMVDNTDEKLGHNGGGSLVSTSTAAVECVLPCCNPEVRPVQSSGVDALFFPLLLKGVCVRVVVLVLLLFFLFGRRMPFGVVGTPKIISACVRQWE